MKFGTSGLIIITTIALVATLAYRIEMLLKEPYAFIAISTEQAAPSYFKNVRHGQLANYLPGITAKVLDNLELHDILQSESLYKIVTPDTFDPSKKNSCVTLSRLDLTSHFIHAALGGQVVQILEKFFKDAPTVLLLELDVQKLQSANITLKKEQNKVDGEFFPHLYGTQKIPISVIKTIIEISKKEGSLATETNRWHIKSIGIIMPCYPQK